MLIWNKLAVLSSLRTEMKRDRTIPEILPKHSTLTCTPIIKNWFNHNVGIVCNSFTLWKIRHHCYLKDTIEFNIFFCWFCFLLKSLDVRERLIPSISCYTSLSGFYQGMRRFPKFLHCTHYSNTEKLQATTRNIQL